MAGMKSLAKDTAIYGLSSILGRFLNWCFVFLYINVLKTTAEYGIVTNLYAYMALLLIILTYGMETGTLEEVYEPYLIKEGFIKRTPRGREVTDLAYTHLNRRRISEQGTLF